MIALLGNIVGRQIRHCHERLELKQFVRTHRLREAARREFRVTLPVVQP